MKESGYIFLFCLLFIDIFQTFCDAAAAHIYTHQQKGYEKERTEDGAFSPRSSNHYMNGEHNQEFDHEVILGSVKKVEEFDRLPKDESKRRLRILLTKMDRNEDNYIERNELKAWILRSFSMLLAEESQDRFEDADANEDKMISWDEILHDTYGSDPEDLSLDDKLINEDKATFEAADLDGDGFLTFEEFKAYTHPEETPRMFPLLLRQTIADKDTNNDGHIDFQEFLGNKAKTKDKEWLLIEKEKFDQDHDKNHDGKLDNTEILSWLIPSNDDIAKDEVDHLFASADEDHDNRLSFEEILEHHDTFVGSEATDYGDHLQDIERFQDEL